MQLNTYLGFNGNCEAAFTFYQRCLGGEIAAMNRYSEMPAEAAGDGEGCAGAEATSPEAQNKIMHARLEVNGQVLMASDSPPGAAHEDIRGMHISVNVDSVDEAERVFAALSENGTVQMPLEETFWAARFGMLVDQFGVPWMVNCELCGQA